MNLKFAANLTLFLTIIVILLLGLHPAWYEHLHTDINDYVYRVNYFLTNGSFNNLPGNDDPPGALFFLALVHFVLPLSDPLKITFSSYLWKLFAVNIILILSLAYLYKKYTKNIKSLFVFSLILLATGPIVLFRFDLFVAILVVLSLYFLKHRKIFFAALLLGAGAIVKIYPLLLLPYLMISQYQKEKVYGVLKTSLSFIAGYLVFLILVTMVLDISSSSIISSFHFLSQRPVHTESAWGTSLTLFAKITTGDWAQGLGGWGVFGISPSYVIGPPFFYNYFWIVPVGVWYLWIFTRKLDNKSADIKIPIATIILFLIFSKVIHHQYLLWFMLLLPLIDPNLFFKKTKWFIILTLVIFTTFINQYVYPLNYSNWMFGFYANGSYQYLFWLIFLRNILLVVILIMFIKSAKDHLPKRS